MSIEAWLTILAIFAGPIVAVQLTRYLDDRREVRDRKLQIFKTLMATRSYSVSWAHVEALNRIDLEFSKSKPQERAVLEAWKEYFDLLCSSGLTPEQWGVKRVDLLVELLHRMAVVLDYDFDKTQIKNSAYSPIAHGNLESQHEALRQGAIDVLGGKRAIPIYVTNTPPDSER